MYRRPVVMAEYGCRLSKLLRYTTVFSHSGNIFQFPARQFLQLGTL